MTFRPFNDPHAQPGCQVDKLIGSSYDVVRHVACHISEVSKVSRYMHDVRTVAHEVFRTLMVKGVAPNIGATVQLPLPTKVTLDNIRDFSVLLVAADGSIYPLGHPAFTAVISSGYLFVAVSPTAPANVVGSQIRWTISYKGDLHEPQ